MNIFPVIIDARPTFERAEGLLSALQAPLADATVLAVLRDGLRPFSDEGWTILTDFDPQMNYRDTLLATGCVERIEPTWALARLLARFEPADQWLLLDVRRWPLDTTAFGRLIHEVRRTGAVGYLLSSADGGDAQEVVHLDEHQRVTHVQRYYPGITWQRAGAAAAALVPVSALRQTHVTRLTDLCKLRRSLTSAGVVSRDVALSGPTLDLTTEAGIIALNACRLHGVTRGRRVLVHPTARLHGPVVLHDDVTLDERATIIGPSVVAAGCHVGRDALLVQCVVCPGTVIGAATTHQRRVLSGEVASNSVATGDCGRALALPRVGERAVPAISVGRGVYARIKPVIEGLVAGLGLLVLSPLLVATALAVKLTSRGPVLFGHIREGRGGRPFRCWKFRTMVHDAHRQQRALYRQNEVDGPQFKLRHDPRITRLGYWLRHTNLDELPQLINVVAGQMSLIGPRPSPFRENQICVPWRRARLSVRPGITGLWQICRHERAAGDFHQWIHYDMLYVRHLSFGLDLRILLATLLTFGGRWSVPVTWLIPAWRLRMAEALGPRPAAGARLAVEW